MIIQEHLRADKLYECRTNGEHHIHVIIKDGEAVVYSTLIDMISHQYLGDEKVTRFYLTEYELEDLYGQEIYEFLKLLNYALRKNV
jgi:hypothetical protein